MEKTTYTRKNSSGNWTTTTTIELGNARRLCISTRKISNDPQLVTTASVCIVDGMFERHSIHKDYYRRIASDPCSRVTANSCEKAHVAAVNQCLTDVLAEVEQHYVGL